MIEMTLQGVAFGVASAPDGARVIRFEDAQSGIAIVVPFDRDSAENLSKLLRPSALQVASGLPDALRRNGS